MIRFVDITAAYYGLDGDDKEDDDTYPHMCAFMDTITNTFIQDDTGQHIFESMEDIESVQAESSGGFKTLSERCKRLVPKGFFTGFRATEKC